MRISPVLAGMRAYPFVRLADARRRLSAAGVEVIDFGVGEPREETPAFIREALAVDPLSKYPAADGLPELREAIAGWVGRRFGTALDPETEVVPTFGSKEAVFHLAQVLDGELVVVPQPAYPVYERGAAFAGKAVFSLPLEAGNGFLPDLDAVPEAIWRRTAVLWLNYPNNPTAATAPPALYERAAALAREHDFVLASDEAYSELYFGTEPPASALQLPDRPNVAVFNTLSKRSSMPGYRSGFVAGDAELVGALKRYRPNVGVAPPEFIQQVAALAWGDEAHVAEVRDVYRAKRDVLVPARGRRCDVLPMVGGGGGRRARATARAGHRAGSRLLLRAGGRGLPAAGAGADPGRVRAGRCATGRCVGRR
jgi:aspartate/methionine/tyrosine aminotransferase